MTIGILKPDEPWKDDRNLFTPEGRKRELPVREDEVGKLELLAFDNPGIGNAERPSVLW